MKHYILASGSPRRKELLEQIGLEFEISVANGEEIITKNIPSEIVEELSKQKAMEIADKYQNTDKSDTTVIIGADTIVAFEADNNIEIMGKPKDKADAKRMLKMIQNNTHCVYTGVTLVVIDTNSENRIITFHEKTEVNMYPMSDEQIDAYIETGEPMDKAGSYAIQGRCGAYIKGIVGDYNNVVGLPIARLYQELLKI